MPDHAAPPPASDHLPCRAKDGLQPLSVERIKELLARFPDWSFESGHIVRAYAFRDYHEVMAFINATAWVSHRENHHPDIAFGFDRVTVRFTTHDTGGVSEKDFVCASRFDRLYEQ